MRRVVGIVDNDPAMLGSLRGLIAAAGYDTEIFSTGEALLAAAATSTPACFVIDIQLGGITGIEVGRRLAARGLGPVLNYRIPKVKSA